MLPKLKEVKLQFNIINVEKEAFVIKNIQELGIVLGLEDQKQGIAKYIPKFLA